MSTELKPETEARTPEQIARQIMADIAAALAAKDAAACVVKWTPQPPDEGAMGNTVHTAKTRNGGVEI